MYIVCTLNIYVHVYDTVLFSLVISRHNLCSRSLCCFFAVCCAYYFDHMIFMYMYSVHVVYNHTYTQFTCTKVIFLQQVVSLVNVTPKTTCSTVQYSKYTSVFLWNHFRRADPCSNSCRAASISDLHFHTSTQFQRTNTLSRKKIVTKSPHRFIARSYSQLSSIAHWKARFFSMQDCKAGNCAWGLSYMYLQCKQAPYIAI